MKFVHIYIYIYNKRSANKNQKLLKSARYYYGRASIKPRKYNYEHLKCVT